MTVHAILEEIRHLRADELRLVAAELDRLDEEASRCDSVPVLDPTLTPAVQWADRTARRREIFGEAVLPNLVLEGRDESRW